VVGIALLVIALFVSVSTTAVAHRSGGALWPGALATALILAGTGIAIGGGIASETTRGERDWLAIGIMVVLAGVGATVYAFVRMVRGR